jgi:hypothetical protein
VEPCVATAFGLMKVKATGQIKSIELRTKFLLLLQKT